jgi:hypothetical protein
MGRREGRPLDNFIPSANPKRLNPLEPGVDEQTRSTLLKLLLHEAEKSNLTSQQLDRIDRHMAALRQLIYRQLELVEKGHDGGQALKQLATMNDLMANYQTLRRRIGPLAE